MRPLEVLIAAGLVAGLAASPALARPPVHAKGGGESFGSQVRALAHERHEADEGPGIGQTVSRMAHDRNAARAEARVTATIVSEPEAKPRGRGRK